MRVSHRIVPLVAVALAGPLAAPGAQAQNSRVIAGNGRSAMDCVRLVVLAEGDSQTSGNGNRVILNECGEPIEATWCYMDGECQRESGNSWTIGPGRSYPVSWRSQLRWAACRGANTVSFEKGSQGSRYICTAPPGKPQPQATPPNSANSVSGRGLPAPVPAARSPAPAVNPVRTAPPPRAGTSPNGLSFDAAFADYRRSCGGIALAMYEANKANITDKAGYIEGNLRSAAIGENYAVTLFSSTNLEPYTSTLRRQAHGFTGAATDADKAWITYGLAICAVNVRLRQLGMPQLPFWG